MKTAQLSKPLFIPLFRGEIDGQSFDWEIIDCARDALNHAVEDCTEATGVKADFIIIRLDVDGHFRDITEDAFTELNAKAHPETPPFYPTYAERVLAREEWETEGSRFASEEDAHIRSELRAYQNAVL